MGPRGQAPAVMLRSKCIYLLVHLTGCEVYAFPLKFLELYSNIKRNFSVDVQVYIYNIED